MYLVDDLPSIKAILEHYGAKVSRNSGQVNLRCPFHDDTHMSASVNIKENIFNCFACGMNGNSIQLIAKQERVNNREAKSIAERITGESHSKVLGKHLSGGRLPQKQGNYQGSSTVGSIRRSRGA